MNSGHILNAFGILFTETLGRQNPGFFAVFTVFESLSNIFLGKIVLHSQCIYIKTYQNQTNRKHPRACFRKVCFFNAELQSLHCSGTKLYQTNLAQNFWEMNRGKFGASLKERPRHITGRRPYIHFFISKNARFCYLLLWGFRQYICSFLIWN